MMSWVLQCSPLAEQCGKAERVLLKRRCPGNRVLAVSQWESPVQQMIISYAHYISPNTYTCSQSAF